MALQASGGQGMASTDLLVYLLDRNDRAVAEFRELNDRAVAEFRKSMKEVLKEVKVQVKEDLKGVKAQVKKGDAALGKKLEKGEIRLRALEDSVLKAQTLLTISVFLYGAIQKWDAIKAFVGSLFSS